MISEKIKSTLLIVLLFLFFSCELKNNEKGTDLEKTILDTQNVSTVFDTIKIDTVTNSLSPNQDELIKALNNPAIDNYYKDIYRQGKYINNDGKKTLSIADSLFTQNQENDLFYFVVFTKSMNGSDGYYSEGLNYSAYKFITTKTEWFADYFNLAPEFMPQLTDKDFDNWVNCVYAEIQISQEDKESKSVKELEKQLLRNIEIARGEYKFVIYKFIKKIKKLETRTI